MLEVRFVYEYNGKPVNEYTIDTGKYKLSALNLGATLTKIIVPNKQDKLESILLRYHDYKLYRENPYYLGALVDVNSFRKNKKIYNYHFNCTPLENGLVFTYQTETKFIQVVYLIIDDKLIINYETNLKIHFGHVLFFNLSGNVKEDIINQFCLIDNNQLDYTQRFKFFKHFPIMNSVELTHENGISLIINNITDAYLNPGTYFRQKHLVNLGKKAKKYSGLGFLIKGGQTVEYSFEIKGGIDESI